MRERPTARLLIATANRRVLLFRFVHKTGALAGKIYWATAGGGVEKDETFVDAAIPELREETGIHDARLFQLSTRLEFPLQLPDGERVLAIEQYFLVNAQSESISCSNWTTEEVDVMAAHRWWGRDELIATTETIYPEGLTEILVKAGVFGISCLRANRTTEMGRERTYKTGVWAQDDGCFRSRTDTMAQTLVPDDLGGL